MTAGSVMSKSKHPHLYFRTVLTPPRTVFMLVSGILVFFILSILVFAFVRPHHSGDTRALISGADAMHSCFKGGLKHCPDIFFFPVFQYVPALIFRLMGLSVTETLQKLVYINILSVIGMMISSILFFRKRHSIGTGLLFVLILFTGPIFWYGKASFNEATAAFVTLLFTMACLTRVHSLILFLLCILTGLTKEVSFPFIILIALTSFWPKIWRNFRSFKTEALAIAAGILISMLLSTGLNYWRFDSPLNAFNMNPRVHVPSLIQHTEFFLGLLFSPNGGLAFFWFSFGLLFLASMALPSRVPHGIPPILKNGFKIGIALVLFGLVFGFSKWYAPFGWVAWGPRFLIPWIPSIALLIIDRSGPDLESALRRASRNQKIILGILLALFSLPQYTINFSDRPMLTLFGPNQDCPTIPHIEESDAYYNCLNRITWPSHVFGLVEAFKLIKSPVVFLGGTLYLFSIWLLLAFVVNTKELSRTV